MRGRKRDIERERNVIHCFVTIPYSEKKDIRNWGHFELHKRRTKNVIAQRDTSDRQWSTYLVRCRCVDRHAWRKTWIHVQERQELLLHLLDTRHGSPSPPYPIYSKISTLIHTSNLCTHNAISCKTLRSRSAANYTIWYSRDIQLFLCQYETYDPKFSELSQIVHHVRYRGLRTSKRERERIQFGQRSGRAEPRWRDCEGAGAADLERAH